MYGKYRMGVLAGWLLRVTIDYPSRREREGNPGKMYTFRYSDVYSHIMYIYIEIYDQINRFESRKHLKEDLQKTSHMWF